MLELKSFITGVIVIIAIQAIIYFAYKISTTKNMDDYELGENGESKKFWGER